MSGYRSLHREQVLAKETALWCVEATPLLLTTAKSSSSTSGSSSGSATSGHGSNQWRIWIASSDGYVRSYTAIESSIDNDDHNSLDASALSLTCTHILTGRTTKEPPPPLAEDDDAPSRPAMGCTRVCTVRNYVGEDDAVGDLIVASLDLGGTIRVWRFPADWDEKNSTGSSDSQLLQPNKQVKCMAEFELENAAGTTMALRVIPVAQEVAVAVGCLNGTIAIVSTGIATPNAKKEAQAAGTILE